MISKFVYNIGLSSLKIFVFIRIYEKQRLYKVRRGR